MRRIVSLMLENEPGALSRVVGLFAQRNYNIESLTVAPTEDATLSRLTVTTIGDDMKIEQITKQLNKLIEVIRVVDLTESDHLERELMLIKLRAASEQQGAKVKQMADSFCGDIVDVTDMIYTVQVSGASRELDAFIHAVGELPILEVVRSGAFGMARGANCIRP